MWQGGNLKNLKQKKKKKKQLDHGHHNPQWDHNSNLNYMMMMS